MKLSAYVEYDTSNNMKIVRMFLLTPCIQDFSTFQTESVPASNNTETGVEGFSWNFQDRSDMRQLNIWYILMMLLLNPGIQDWFVYALGPCLPEYFGETGQRIFLKFSWYKEMGKLCLPHLNFFTVLKLGAESCLVQILWKMGERIFNEFFKIFKLYSRDLRLIMFHFT